jgi:hypothetical protein
MRALAAVFLFAIAVLPIGAQQDASKPSVETSVPKGPCRYERMSVVRQVKGTPPIEDRLHFDVSVLTERRVFFPIGALVSVNRQEGLWSCVSGSAGLSSSSPFRTGWMRSSFLGQVEE